MNEPTNEWKSEWMRQDDNNLVCFTKHTQKQQQQEQLSGGEDENTDDDEEIKKPIQGNSLKNKLFFKLYI